LFSSFLVEVVQSELLGLPLELLPVGEVTVVSLWHSALFDLFLVLETVFFGRDPVLGPPEKVSDAIDMVWEESHAIVPVGLLVFMVPAHRRERESTVSICVRVVVQVAGRVEGTVGTQPGSHGGALWFEGGRGDESNEVFEAGMCQRRDSKR